MNNAIVTRLASLTAAFAVTVSLLFGVTGIAHASAAVATTAVATSSAVAAQA